MSTAAEQAIIDQTNKAIAAGEDPFGDNDGFEATTKGPGNDQAAVDEVSERAAAEAAAQAAADATTQADGEKNGEGSDIDPAALESIANGNDDPISHKVADPLNFNVNAPADYKTARAALLAEKAEAMSKLMNGEIDADEYAQIEIRVMDGLEDLSAQRIRAETLQEVNTQSAVQSQNAVIQALITRTKDEVPYATDAKAQKQFDIALHGLIADPDNSAKSFAELASEAHTVVLALRGVTPKPAVADPAPRKPEGVPPVTLRSIPSAATANTGGSMMEQLSRLSGQEYEAAYAKLTPQQKAALLDD